MAISLSHISYQNVSNVDVLFAIQNQYVEKGWCECTVQQHLLSVHTVGGQG